MAYDQVSSRAGGRRRYESIPEFEGTAFHAPWELEHVWAVAEAVSGHLSQYGETFGKGSSPRLYTGLRGGLAERRSALVDLGEC